MEKFFYSQTTDNGGGGTLESFLAKLCKRGLTADSPTYTNLQKFYFANNCTLHNLQLIIAIPVENVFGSGGLEEYNALQLLDCAYQVCWDESMNLLEFSRSFDLVTVKGQLHMTQEWRY